MQFRKDGGDVEVWTGNPAAMWVAVPQCVVDHVERLEAAILDIDAKAAPYGAPLIENGEAYVQAYVMPAGPLHRALGVIGRSAVKTITELTSK